MEKFQIGEQAVAAAELEALFQYNAFSYEREENRFYLVFSDKGYKWETMCICRGSLLIIYGRYPFVVEREEAVSRFCQQVNKTVVSGSMFWCQERLLFRTGADLFDAYSAYEQIGRALEYNAGVMVHFWKEASEAVSQSNVFGVKPNAK